MYKGRFCTVQVFKVVGVVLKLLKLSFIVSETTDTNSEKLTRRIQNTVFTSSTCSVGNGSSYLDLPRSRLESLSLSK